MSTELQAAVSVALQDLKFDVESGNPGAPMKHTVTDATLEYLKGKTVIVDSDGKVSVE